ncbi:MAG: hypothetical protein ACM3P1_06830 [Candidatus Saccharibacteria bacterium]
MKNKFKLLVTGSLTAILLIPCMAYTQSQDQKKTRHIRMVKVENGKKMEIDTVLTGNDVFVWNGDTINPEKHIEKFSPSEFDKRHPERVHKMIMQADSGEDVRIITEDGDTLGEKIIIHKKQRNGDENNHWMQLDGANDGHFPPMPPVPPMHRFKVMHSSKMINLNDPNVISFKKKDISGGREKIEIIRKKTTEQDNQDFNIDIDDELQVPGPPAPPVIHKQDKDMLNMEKGKNTSKGEKKK